MKKKGDCVSSRSYYLPVEPIKTAQNFRPCVRVQNQPIAEGGGVRLAKLEQVPIERRKGGKEKKERKKEKKKNLSDFGFPSGPTESSQIKCMRPT